MSHHLEFGKILSKGAKEGKKEDKVPNYSKYKYTKMIQTFSETDRLLESELNSLECYDTFQLEVPLNSFSETTLNNHLYKIYCKKQLVSVETMRKLVSFFVRHYKTLLEPKVQAYLDSKKLTLDHWLDTVKNNRRGDILCVYFFEPGNW